ncbi:hypothetical protein HAX54_043706 [Datura stramonium]|uniref:RRM domain-containing protein n=1 Tax=Datura stramonium TaxID=4076 RepID=A0ABS8W4U2_DATST|nr:hypothetical protein [Datura stramonium]
MAPPSNNLWVGNLAHDVTDADLRFLFEKYGPLDRVTSYSSRGFGFIYFKNINDSMEAKDALQGFFFHGLHLKIKFANTPSRGSPCLSPNTQNQNKTLKKSSK